jgi:hypothetical protein
MRPAYDVGFGEAQHGAPHSRSTASLSGFFDFNQGRLRYGVSTRFDLPLLLSNSITSEAILPSISSRRLLEIENIGDQVVGLGVRDYQIRHCLVI